MRFSDTECIQKFLAKWDSISARDREYLSIEAVALAAKVDIRHLWGEIMLAMREHSVNSVKVIAVAHHPEIIKKQIEFAQTPGGYRDRDSINLMLGALPTPKNTTTFINKIVTSAKDEESAKQEVEEVVDDLDYIFPDASAMQERIQPVRQKLLGK